MKKTVFVFLIHGGMTFKSRKDYLRFLRTRKISIEDKKGWSGEYLAKSLGSGFKVVRPRMPLADNARYGDWKIYFERFLPYIKGKFILVGVSLGGIFLAKYFSEHKLKKRALAVYLVSPPFDNTVQGEDLVGGFRLGSDLSLLEKNSKKLCLMFSADDKTVPLAHAEKYRKKLRNAEISIYERKNGHFKVSKFPELVRMIKTDVKKK